VKKIPICILALVAPMALTGCQDQKTETPQSALQKNTADNIGPINLVLAVPLNNGSGVSTDPNKTIDATTSLLAAGFKPDGKGGLVKKADDGTVIASIPKSEVDAMKAGSPSGPLNMIGNSFQVWLDLSGSTSASASANAAQRADTKTDASQSTPVTVPVTINAAPGSSASVNMRTDNAAPGSTGPSGTTDSGSSNSGGGGSPTSQ
jgi:hypothetical protein